MPESWLKKAMKNASRIGTWSRRVQNRPAVTPSDEAAAIAFACSCSSSEVEPGRMSPSTAIPAARSPLRPMSQRGLSGSVRQSAVYNSAGIASTPSIQRHACSPMPPSIAFERNAMRMPKTMLN